MGTAIFDVCDTLYDANTTVGFLRYVGNQGHRPVARAVRRWTDKSHPLFWVGAVAQRWFGTDIARRQLLNSLKGLGETDIRAMATSYVTNVLPEFRNGPMFDLLDQHRASGDRLILASNSLAPIVEAIAEPFGATPVGSTLTYRDGISTGSLATDLTGTKSLALAAACGTMEHPVTVYTDNRTDADLIAMADRAFIVIPKGRPLRKWAGDDYDYIQL